MGARGEREAADGAANFPAPLEICLVGRVTSLVLTDVPTLPVEPAATRPGSDVSSARSAREGAGASAEGTTKATDLAWVVSSNFAEGFPYSLVHQVSAQLFVSMGASFSTVGLTAAYGWAWNLKFLTAPFVDRIGKPRHWVVVLELLLALATLAVSAGTTSGSLGTVGALFLVVALLAATHDVAVDAHYIAALDPKAQNAFSGIRIGAYRLAMLTANGGIVVIAGVMGFQFGFALAAVILLLLAALHFKVLFRGRERAASATPAVAAKLPLGEGLKSFLGKPKIAATIAFLVCYRAGDALMFAMNVPFLEHLGLDTSTRGLVQGTIGTLLSIGGAIVGGLVISRRGLSRTLFPIAVLQSISILLYVLVAELQPPIWAVSVLTSVEQFAAGVGTAGLTVFILRVARGPHRATHYAVASALMSLATTLLGLGSGFLLEKTGFPLYFSIAFCASIPGVALSLKVRDAHAEQGV